MSSVHPFRYALCLFLALQTCCASVSNAPTRDNSLEPSEALEKPWELAMQTCHVNTIAMTVDCPTEDFRKIMKSTVSLWEQLQKTENRLDSAVKLGLVDKAELEAKVFDLDLKLHSPWRSPYLWAAIGLAVGLVVGVGVCIGIK